MVFLVISLFNETKILMVDMKVSSNIRIFFEKIIISKFHEEWKIEHIQV
jgi:hypothetical protein